MFHLCFLLLEMQTPWGEVACSIGGITPLSGGGSSTGNQRISVAELALPIGSESSKGRKTAMTERHLEHKETLSNGCSIRVKAEILKDGSLGMFIGVYWPDGSVIDENHDPKPHMLDMEAAMDWGIDIAKGIGNSQRTL
jgi:hypothetical protein